MEYNFQIKNRQGQYYNGRNDQLKWINESGRKVYNNLSCAYADANSIVKSVGYVVIVKRMLINGTWKEMVLKTINRTTSKQAEMLKNIKTGKINSFLFGQFK